ncbi:MULTISPECIES: hypothetical protein [Xanthobacteraceae]|jgi:hypothetical protein|nr:hypothetical protein [Ancylobacter dichloromethanicus]MBS7556096.1 hypothetical protein [Ancylobacter dichloromethanicus]OYY32457.1 MAG: hypothetical protein B7Y57_30225 [Rhodospirillales bacterium 35-66-84]
MKPVLMTAFAVVLSACSGPPAIEVGPSPSDASSSVKPLRYAPVTAGTVDYRPVDPKPWIERNERVAPKTGGE